MVKLCFILLLLLCENSVKPMTVPIITTLPTTTATTTKNMTTAAWIPDLHLEATPDYPVAAGQTVSLHCRTQFATCSWKRLRNNSWHEVGMNCSDLILTEPEQSGKYLCSGRSHLVQRDSRNHTVYIISIQTTAGEKFGIAAFIISLVTFIITLVLLFWMIWQRFDHKETASGAAVKGFPGPGMASKGGLPEMGSETDVYMNYTNTNAAYSDLDPNRMAQDNVYSSLS